MLLEYNIIHTNVTMFVAERGAGGVPEADRVQDQRPRGLLPRADAALQAGNVSCIHTHLLITFMSILKAQINLKFFAKFTV